MIHVLIIAIFVGIAFYLKHFSADPLVEKAFAFLAGFSWIIFFAFRLFKGNKEIGDRPAKLDAETRKYWKDYDPLSELDESGRLKNSPDFSDNSEDPKSEDER